MQTPGVQVQIKYWISLPSAHAHTGHPVGNEAGFSQRIHPLLASKITEMVISGITSTSEVKRSLNFHAATVLAPQLGITLSKQNMAFYPTSTDVRNHIYIAKKALELSKIDQENVLLKVEQFRKRDLFILLSALHPAESGSTHSFIPQKAHKLHLSESKIATMETREAIMKKLA